MSRRALGAPAEPAYGLEPRANLLPPEVLQKAKARRTHGMLMVLSLVVVGIVAAVVVLSYFYAARAQLDLAEAQAESVRLLDEQKSYAEVTTTSEATRSIEDARVLGTSTEVVWGRLLEDVAAVMPAGSAYEKIDGASGVPWAPDMGIGGPLRAPRVATMTIEVLVVGISNAASLTRSLEGLDWVADVTLDLGESEDGITYIATYTINVGADALENRFPGDQEAQADTGGSDD